MRRLIGITLAVLGLVTLAACGSGASPSPSAAATPAATEPAASEPAASEPAGSAPASAACAESTDAATVDLTIADFAFSPNPAQATVGDVVTWTNEDSAPHSAAFEGCETSDLSQGDSGSLVFNEPGTYDYVCGIHPTMTATLEVTE